MSKKKKKGKERLDKFYYLAKDQGYRARSAFKLIQLAKMNDFLSKARVCIDLCAAPGGWSQVAQRNMPAGALVVAIDLVPIKAIHGVTCIQSDITSDKCRSLLKKELKGIPADIVLHDGSPNVGTSWAKDAYSQAELTLHALKLACEHLRPGGTFVSKVFRSSDYNSLLWVFGQLFNKVDATKPTASRNVSAEIFVVCTAFKAGKIDPRFFEPKWVFMETRESMVEAGIADKKPSAFLHDHFKYQAKRHRSGYEPGDDFRVITAHDFFASEHPAALLVTHHQVNLDAAGSESIKEHPLTTQEVRECCADLKVLGKADLSALLRWRMKIIRLRERAERAARKAEKKSGELGSAELQDGNATSAANAVAKDVDVAITDLLDKTQAGSGSDVDEVAEEEIERELAEQVEKRRREERREAKKMMTRQKKQEMRRKMSLGTANALQDQPELFRCTRRSVKALEDQDKYLDPHWLESGGEEESNDGQVATAQSDSDDGLDRLTRLEVDVAVAKELEKIHNEDHCRNMMQRRRKRKKETRRQRVMAAWAGELNEFSAALEGRAAEEKMLRDKEDADDDADGDDSEQDLEDLREFQDFQRRMLEDAPAADGGPDALALEALAAGPGRARAVEELDDVGASRRGLPDASAGSALVALDETAGEEVLRAQHRAARWFSQDIFQHAQSGDDDRTLRRRADADAASGDEHEGSGAEIVEVDDSRLPMLPLTDKAKRKLQRKRDLERLERRGKKPKTDEVDRRPLEVAPLEPPQPLVPSSGSKFEKPSDPRELAETLALGSLLVASKKSRMELIDAAYNKWTFEGDEDLPDWFTEEENMYNKPELPVSKELMDQFRAKLREINARPIRKVTQAKARKFRRLKKRLEKLRETATSLIDAGDMSAAAQARQMRRAVSKMAGQDRRKVTVVAVKKGGGGIRSRREKGKVPKGAKVKVVDRRMKADRRGERKANKRNPARQKAIAKKKSFMKSRTNGRKTKGAGKQSSAKRKKKGDGSGIYGT